MLRSRWLFGAVLLLAIVMGGKMIHRAMQPKYEGKTVEEWFADWKYRNSEMPEPQRVEVCTNLGTNAVWYLWGEYRRNDSVVTAWIMEKKHRFFGSGYQFETSHERQRHLKALSTLHLLGGQCEPLIPEIVKHLKSSNPVEACNMVSLLGSIRQQPDLVVPVIHLSLLSTNWESYQRKLHIDALGKFGPAAKSVLPELQKRFANPAATNQGENHHLARAILRINGPGPELGLFTNGLAAGDFVKSFSDICFLEQVGTNARSAAPILRDFMGTLTNESEIRYVIQVIQEIDPEARQNAP